MIGDEIMIDDCSYGDVSVVICVDISFDLVGWLIFIDGGCGGWLVYWLMLLIFHWFGRYYDDDWWMMLYTLVIVDWLLFLWYFLWLLIWLKYMIGWLLFSLILSHWLDDWWFPLTIDMYDCWLIVNDALMYVIGIFWLNDDEWL